MQAQFERINTVPAVQLQHISSQLVQVMQSIDRLGQGIDRLEQDVRRLEQKVDRIDAKMENHNTNSMARLQNSFATSPSDPLMPLRNPATGGAIPNLPPDSSAIAGLSARQIRDILHELGHVFPNDQGGGITWLRKQLRTQMGLRAQPAQVA